MYIVGITDAFSTFAQNLQRSIRSILAFFWHSLVAVLAVSLLASVDVGAAECCVKGDSACPTKSTLGLQTENFTAEGPSVFFSKLFDVSDFPARWYCGEWSSDVGWLHIVSDVAIFGAYFAIPVALLYFLLRRPELPFPKVIWLFAAFILSCGIGHLIEAGIFWWPVYRLSGLVKAITAMISWTTVFAIIRLLPQALNLPSAAIIARELKESKDRLNFALESAHIGVWEWNLKTDSLSFDKTTRQIFDIDPEVPMSFDLFVDCLHSEDRERVEQLVKQSLKTGCPYDTEYRCIHRDGSVHHIRAEGKVIRGQEGELELFIGVVLDFTAKKCLDDAIVESESNFRSTFENAAMGIVHVAPDGTCLRVNQGFCSIVGYTEQELIGSSFQDIVHPDDLDDDLHHVAKALSGETSSYSLEKRYVRKDGTSIWGNLTSSLVRTSLGDPKHFVNVVQNIQKRKEAESNLREYTEQVRKLSLVASKTQHSVVIGDPGGQIEWVNRAFTELTGYTSEDVLGKRPGDFLQGPDTDSDTVKLIGEKLSRNESVAIEIVNYRKSGEKYWIDLKIDPVLNEAGELVQFIATQVDITERKNTDLELQKQRGRFESFLRSDIVGIATCRLDGTVEQANDEMLRILGFSREDMESKKINLRVLTPREYEKVDAGFAQAIIQRGSIKPFEKEFFRKDGSLAPVVVGATRIKGEEDLTLCLALDATFQKETEEKLIEAKLAAEQSSQAKSEFLAAMSHELRTPLNGVIGMSELLSDTELDSRQQRFVKACQSSGKALMTLINDILDFSKIESGQLELDEHPFDLLELLDDVMTSMPIRVEEKNIELLYQLDHPSTLHLMGDSHRLRQVIVNLVGNAIKFTEEGEISILAKPEQLSESEATIRFTVTDTGIGIPQDRLHRLFRSFSQIDSSTSRKYGGSGLGLSICKSLIDAMNGTIDVKSTEGVGSTFWFTVTFKRIQGRVPACLIKNGELHHLRILVVEDNDECRLTLVSMLECWKMHVDSTTEPDEAFELLQRAAQNGNSFDIALVNLTQSDHDVMRFAERVKDDSLFSGLKLILIAPMNVEFTATPIHFDDCLRKPVGQSSLLNTIVNQCCSGNPITEQNVVRECHDLIKTDCDSSNIRILLAEDNAINRMFAAEILARSNWSFDTAGNGREAIEAIMNAEYDVILMDCQMPEVDGFEATRQIRQMEADGRLLGRRSILALTANAIKGDRERCIDAGMDNYVAKPFHPEELTAAINQLLSKKENEPQSNASSEPKLTAHADAFPIDTEVLLDRCMGDISFAESLLSSFATDGPNRLIEILRQAELGDVRAVGETAHALKGIAGIVAAKNVESCAAKVESLGKAGNLQDLRCLMDELKECVEDCLRYMPIAQRLTQ